MNEKNVSIIGGGISGLSLALELCNLGIKPIIFERSPYLGGLAASIHHNGYKMDIGPHFVALPLKSDVTDFVYDVMGKENVLELPTDTFKNFYKTNLYGEIFDTFPSIYEALSKFGKKFMINAFVSFSIAQIKNSLKNSEFKTSDEYIISTYGKFLYKTWFKLWINKKYSGGEAPLEEIKRKFPPVNFSKIISKRKKQKKLENNSSTNDDEQIICYFKEGMGSFIDSLKQKILDKGGEIYTNTEIKKINHEQGKKIMFIENNIERELNSDAIVYTLPLNIALQWFENVPEHLLENFSKMDTQHTIMMFLFIDTPKLFNSWVMIFYDLMVSISRISQQNFLSKYTVPENKTLLCVEINIKNDNPILNEEEETIFKKVKTDLRKVGVIKNEKIDGYKIIKLKNLIPNAMKKNDPSKKVMELINKYENEFAVGTEKDLGKLASDLDDDEPQKITYGAGIYYAILKSKKLGKIIQTKLENGERK